MGAEILLREVADHAGLTPREREVFELTVWGVPTKCVATQLGITTWTVAEHLRSIYEKAGVSGRGQLAALVLARAS